MKPVKLYSIVSKDVMLADDVMFMYIHDERYYDRIIPTNDLKFLVSDKCEIETIKLQVHRVSRIEYGIRKDQYIALHPELQEILQAPFTSEAHRLKCESLNYQTQLKNLKSKVNGFNSLPWWKRVWFALKREVRE